MNILWLVLLLTLVKTSKADGDSEVEEMDYVDGLIESCKEAVGATDDDVQELIERNPEVSHEGKCVLECVGREIGIVNEGGKFNLAAAKHILSLLPVDSSEVKEYEEVIDKCSNSSSSVEDEDKCDVAYMFVKCLTEETENL